MTKVSSLPLLGLESFHECLDRYSAKGQMGKTSGVCAWPGVAKQGKLVGG